MVSGCKYDGGDCGGPFRSKDSEVNAPTAPSAYANTPLAPCMLTNEDVRRTPVPPEAPVPQSGSGRADPLSGWKYNFWEPCNGAGTCILSGTLQQPARCQCDPLCGGVWQPGAINIPTGISDFNSVNNEAKCLYCGPKTNCGREGAPACKPLVETTYVGIEDRIEPWDGILDGGGDVFNPDRKVRWGERKWLLSGTLLLL